MSSNLNITSVAASQNNKYITINDGVAAIDAALTEVLTSDFTSGNVTLTDAQCRENVCHILDNVAVARDFTVPAIKHMFIVIGETGNTNTATVTRGTTTEAIVADDVKLMYTDGTANGLFVIAGGGGGDLVDDLTPQLGGDLSANSQSVFWAMGADVASATELLVLTDGNSFDVTGTTAITSIEHTADAFDVGSVIMLQFDGVLTLTHHATDLVLPTGANITTAAGDVAWFQKYATGDWRCVDYTRANGQPLVAGTAIPQYFSIVSFDYTVDTAVGDGAGYFHIPPGLNGMNLTYVHAEVITAGVTGTTDIQIANVTQAADMLSTKLTIDTTETGSDTAVTPAVIDTANDDVATNDLIRIDVDAISTTAAKGLILTLGFETP